MIHANMKRRGPRSLDEELYFISDNHPANPPKFDGYVDDRGCCTIDIEGRCKKGNFVRFDMRLNGVTLDRIIEQLATMDRYRHLFNDDSIAFLQKQAQRHANPKA